VTRIPAVPPWELDRAPDHAVDALQAADEHDPAYRTWVKPWTPGEAVAPELIRLESGPVLLELLAARARTVWVNYRAKRRILAGIPEPFRSHLGHSCARDALELRGLLRDRRAIRAAVERAEDRVDAEAKA
jgi:hypothetical protein